MPSIPAELVSQAQDAGIDSETINQVYDIIQQTPAIPVKGIAIAGQPLGAGEIRIAREYDSFTGDVSLVTLDAPDAQVRVAFLVDRKALAEQAGKEFDAVVLPIKND